MKSLYRKSKALLGTLAFSVGIAAVPNAVQAADSSFINEVSVAYSQYEQKKKAEYVSFLLSEQTAYQTYYNQKHADYANLLELTRQDLTAMLQKLQSDVIGLRAKYGENNDALKAYERAIDKDRADSPMDLYEDAIDPDNAGSAMDLIEDSIDQDRADSPMDLYQDAIDPNTADSPMDLYEDAVDPDTADSPMDRYQDEADIHYGGGTMDLYEDGDITKEEAQKRMASVRNTTETALAKQIGDSKNRIRQTKSNTEQQIQQTRASSIQLILKQRDYAIRQISELRKQLTGSGIAFEPLVIHNWITVIIDGEMQFFDQPPVVMKGSTLVPLRAIFEKLGAEVTWNAKEQSVTAKKGDSTVWLKIGSSKAKINGRNVDLQSPPQTINGSTMVPLRFVSEALGAEVLWDAETSTITITSK